MDWQSALYVLALFVATVVMIILAIYAWQRRRVIGAKAFALAMVLAAWLALTASFSFISPTPTAESVWFCLGFIGLAGMPVAWFIFAFQLAYPQRELGSLITGLLLAIPLVTQIVIWTNGLHQWFFRTPLLFEKGVNIITESGSSIFGPWFWVHTVYSYTLTALAVILIFRTAIRMYSIYRSRAIALIIGALVPLLGSFVSTFTPEVLGDMNLTAFGFMLCGLLWTWAMPHYRLFDVVPVARDTLIDSMNDGMLVMNAENQIVDLNPALANVLGIPARRAVGQSAVKILQHWPNLIDHLQTTTDTPVELSLQYDGILYHYELSNSVLYNRQGQPSGRLIVLHDITIRKQAEEALREYAAELEASNAELDAFAHTVAHDLKNPLSALIALSTFLETRMDNMSPANVRERLHRITQRGYRMNNIVDELLLLASVRRLEEVDTRTLDMSLLVTKALERLANVEKMHQAEITMPDNWPLAQGYGPWVEEVWVNYISNALKYGGQPESGIPPRIELGFDEQDTNAHVRFWVRDNGQGLTEEERAQLFTQFTRLHKVRAEGHGLGLSIVQRIIERLEGTVGVESAPGEGSVFYFTLPRQMDQ
jgi:PAS domain S-box-containing protein